MSGKNILVVDDELIVNLDIQQVLKRHGYTVVGSAASGEDALQLVSEVAPDLVLLDIKLKGEIDGIHVANEINQLYDIPVVFLSAFSDEGTLNQVKSTEAFGYLIKPFVESDLCYSIEVALHKHQFVKELREARKEAELSNEAKSAFLARVSHELRTPMNGILGLSQILSDSDLNDEQKEYVDLIYESASSLLLVLNDLVDYSNLEQHVIDLKEGEFKLEKVLLEVIEAHSNTAAHKNIKIDYVYDALHLASSYVGDSGRLIKILNNLVGNAIKYTDKGKVIIKVYPAKSQPVDESKIRLEFCVTDTGAGIPESRLANIFESFTQEENFMTRTKGGLGLGLALVARLVRLLNGDIWVESTLGSGSSFYFTIVMGRS